MDLKQLAHSHPDAMVVVEAKLIHKFGHGMTLAQVISEAWEAGYTAKEHENEDRVRRDKPEHWTVSGECQQAKTDEARARAMLRNSGLQDAIARASFDRKWTWYPETSSWGIQHNDCTIRPGAGGIILMEAGGEYSGKVITDHDIAEFPEGTFN